MMMKKNEKLEVRDVAVDAIESTELVEAPEKKQPKKIWLDRKSTRLNSSHRSLSRMPSSA